MSQSIERIAHRGGLQLAPENTLAAFRQALTLPVEAIELDVHVSRDGYLVVIHDNNVEEQTDGTGNILDLDFAYLRSLNAAAHFPGGWPEPQQIPTLREVLELTRDRLKVYIEIKPSKRDHVYGRYPQIIEKVVREVQELGLLDQVVLISFDWHILPLVKSIEPALGTGVLVSEDVWDPRAEYAIDSLVEQATALGCDWIHLDAELFTAEMPARLHEHGFKLGIWTINTVADLQRIAAAGVDALETDRPDLFSELTF